MYNCTINMKIVIDTSVIIAVVANEKHRQRLVELTRGADLVAPASLHWEVGNAFSAMLKKERITLEQTFGALAAYAGIAIRFCEVGLKETLGLCLKTNLYAYDAYFIHNENAGLPHCNPRYDLQVRLGALNFTKEADG